MKNILFIFGILISSACYAQSYKVGKIDADGKITMNVDQSKGCSILNQFSTQRNASPVHVNEISFTRLTRGQVCLTGYEKDGSGKIIKGIRIQCSQDDENNLIVGMTNYSESVTGKSFDPVTAQN